MQLHLASILSSLLLLIITEFTFRSFLLDFEQYANFGLKKNA